MKNKQGVWFREQRRIFQDMSLEEQDDFWEELAWRTKVDGEANLDKMSGAEIRMMMVKSGWHSEDSYSTFGWETCGYSIWFKRFDWHGVKAGITVTFHASTNELDKVEQCVRLAAKRALDAWERFKDSVPYQLADGSLGEDKVATKIFRDVKNAR